MTDLDNYILIVVEDKAPIKNVDLAVEIAKHQHGVTESDIAESLKRLASAGKIMEIQYILPNVATRTKSIFFPGKTNLKVLGR